MTNPELTEIVLLVDRSGSMLAIADDMVGAIRQLLTEQAALPGTCRASIYQFDTGPVETVCEGVPVGEVPDCQLVPRGMTALLDAACTVIDRVGSRLASVPDGERPGRIVFAIITDGHENASREFKREHLLSRVERQTSEYGWQFVYLGANQDAIAEARQYGIVSSMNYVADPSGVPMAAASLSSSIASYRSGATATVEVPQNA